MTTETLLFLSLSLAIGFAYGFVAQREQFCFSGGIKDIILFKHTRRTASLIVAITTTIILTQVLGFYQELDFQETRYYSNINYLFIILGGILFGYGMMISDGCSSRHLIKMAQGEKESFFIIISLGIFAFLTYKVLGIYGETIYNNVLVDFFQTDLALALPIVLVLLFVFFLLYKSLKKCINILQTWDGFLIGRLIYFLHKLKLEKHGCTYETIKLETKSIWGMAIVSGLIGVGGAFALVAFRELNNSLDPYLISNTKNIMFNFTLSVIAGFTAKTLLPSIASKLEKQMSQQKELVSQHTEELGKQRKINEKQSKKLGIQSERLKKQSKIFKEHEDKYRKMVNWLSAEFAFTEESLPSDIDLGIQGLEENLEINPLDRRSALFLGRLYADKKQNYSKSIEVLSSFIENKKETFDKDYADALYNLSCHKIELAFKTDISDNEDIILEALDNLKKSIELSPINIKDASEEGDFFYIREREDFKKIVPKYTGKERT
jgi:uncharacterized membrane protein YedE/YeeE